MLSSLSIRNILLIDKIDLSFGFGLCIFSGETGAGKSVILDALGQALGHRADAGLIRKNSPQGSVTAGFEISAGHPVLAALVEQGLEAEGNEVFLRRVIKSDGRSKASINDVPVSVGLLSQIADMLIEIHGQHDAGGLLKPAGHLDLLDAYGGHEKSLRQTAKAHAKIENAGNALEKFRAELAAKAADADYFRHCLEELEQLDPQNEEEQSLSQSRTLMMQGEKVSALIDEVTKSLSSDRGFDAELRIALRKLERIDTGETGVLEPGSEALTRALHELEDGLAKLESVHKGIGGGANRLEEIEERLFALRALARKHRCEVDDLVRLKEDLKERLSNLDKGEAELAALTERFEKLDQIFCEAAGSLSKDRRKAAVSLDKATNRELKPLKLDRARFRTEITPKPRPEWGAAGAESVSFEVSTNLGDDFGALAKIASGGEMSRFVLALKVVLANQGGPLTQIFDEVDRGVGGATASAVGDRLASLSTGGQVIVVTHSPQVAALADHHWLISKHETGNQSTVAKVNKLNQQGRREELARMLAGASITDEARAAAEQLLEPAAGGPAA